MIKILRVDDRLIHGQVAFSWINVLKANLILVANDEYANNSMLKMSLNIGKPPGIKMRVSTIVDAVEILNSEAANKYRIFLVVKSTADALAVINNLEVLDGFDVNLGGVRSTDEKASKLVAPLVYLTENDIDNLEKISEKGLRIYAQDVPANREVSYKQIKKTFKS